MGALSAEATTVHKEKHGALTNVADILRCLRRDIIDRAAEGKTWHGAFDDLRDAVRTLWTDLHPLAEQQRFRRHLKSCGKPGVSGLPEVQAVLDDYQKARRLTISAARITSARGSEGGRSP